MAGTKFILITGVLVMCHVSARLQLRDALPAPSLSGCDPKGVEPLNWWGEKGMTACPDGKWRCLNGEQLIPCNATCSGTAECADGSDEFKRFCGCKSDEFRCGDKCIPCLERCNKKRNCPNGEDEENCSVHKCPKDYTQCDSDYVCVPRAAVCNITKECEDGSDEKNCTKVRKCYKVEFTCDNGECLRPYSVCDGRADCEDATDERDCEPSDFVTCKSGKKIHKFWQCNNYSDCSEDHYDDDTDEQSCECTEHQYSCSNGRCIFKGNVCDSKCDCQDCADEKNCTHIYTNATGVVECLKGKSVECSGRCIAPDFVCDGILHCQGLDHTELGCYNHIEKRCTFPETAAQKAIRYFQCEDKRCLPAKFLCDGRRHCVNGEDEVNCGENGACSPDEFQCWNGSCIPQSALCNGVKDCLAGLDEIHCKSPGQERCAPDEWPCKQDDMCIPRSMRCDTVWDCADRSDEQYCGNNSCPEDKWRCDSGHCVSRNLLCNSEFNCPDKSDEMNCNEHKCQPHEMKCKAGGQCVPRSALCNYSVECFDHSDEQNCERRPCQPGEWQCRNGQCILKEHLCVVFEDDLQGCIDHSHLINCSNATCGKGMYQCMHGHCIDERMRCNRKTECPGSWEDEDDCPFLCSGDNNRCKCLDQEIKCLSLGLTTFPRVEPNIKEYIFAHNRIGETLHLEPIRGHQNAAYLDLCDNHVTQLGNGTLSGLYGLKTLRLCNNQIANITHGNFKGLTRLINLDLSGNQITRLGPQAFDGLDALSKLDLRHQQLTEIEGNAFVGLKSLRVLLLSHNHLTAITHPQTFAGLPHLENLLLSHNLLIEISHRDTFATLPRLLTLFMDNNPLEHVHNMVFEPLQILDKLSTPEFRFCCLPHHAKECLPRTEEFSSCEDLMSNLVLRVFVWVMGLVALIGNTFVIVWRLMYPSGNKKNHSMLFVNLAFGDLLMGVYLLVIAGVDLMYRGVYRLHERQWRDSYLCKTAGFLSTFSSEASVFTLTVITLDRLTILISPYGIRRVHEGLAKRVMVGVWLLAFSLAAVPLFSMLPYFDNFYGRSGVCLALHITNEKPNGWEYSVFIFLALNLLSFSIIAVSYILIYAGARDTPLMESGKTKHGKDRQMGRRVTYIVGTDAACWLPIIMLGIASLSGMQIPRKVFAWVAVFVLPLNAALNPLLYTFFTEPVRKRLKDMRDSITSWHTRSTRSSVISGVRMTPTYRGRMTTDVTDIPLTTTDGKVHTKASICVYTPATSTSAQVTHFIVNTPDQAEEKRLDEYPLQKGSETMLHATPASEAEEDDIVPLETLTADRPAAQKTSGRYSRKKNATDQRYD